MRETKTDEEIARETLIKLQNICIQLDPRKAQPIILAALHAKTVIAAHNASSLSAALKQLDKANQEKVKNFAIAILHGG